MILPPVFFHKRKKMVTALFENLRVALRDDIHRFPLSPNRLKYAGIGGFHTFSYEAISFFTLSYLQFSSPISRSEFRNSM